ncbi:copper resistance D family protein [Pseudonocardia asaccharolytica]|uniref:Copper resistance protein D domain-containing protein n=1 Tax=Pseudonocardia asaccharolytica DSM 44247 = NBRC 16224 TaxID=1123024 RepID=A0A511CV32_9PSEU|nr:CopD family protein [Pseudonocardia asaccharolytica]GEL16432.1 hypothetical protein PA7_02690 [Pseudonocardia asaccharolytica DSM 44247 = NBRC 16224]
MSQAIARPGPVAWLQPAVWTGLAIAAAVLASALAGSLGGAPFATFVGAAASRAAIDLAAVGCVGLALIGVLLPTRAATQRQTADLRERVDRSLVALGGGWVVLVLVGIVYRAAEAFAVQVTDLEGGELARWATQLAAGRGMLLTAGCAATVLGCAVVRVLRPEQIPVRVVLVAAILGALTPSVTGHAGSASTDHQLAATLVAMHVAATALWVGGLGATLVLIAHRAVLLGAVLPRFSRLAGVCLGGVVLTGGLNALIRLPTVAALWTTSYGWLVVTKTVCVILLGYLGLLARRRLAAGRTPVLRWAGLETMIMAATLGVAAALTQTAI